jgi:DNA-binding MarR family transcriptional regulator
MNMSSIVTSPKAAGDGRHSDLYLNTVGALIKAGERVVDELTSISGREGLSSKPMAIAVWYLSRMERVTAGDLARRCGCDAGNLSSMLERLEKAGLAERTPCPNDRRVRYVQLTAKGRRIGARMHQDYVRSGVYKVLNRLDAREREAFTKILTDIAWSAPL